MATHPLNGSERAPYQDAKSIGTDPNERLEVTVLVRRRSSASASEFPKYLATSKEASGLSADPCSKVRADQRRSNNASPCRSPFDEGD